jgi:multiple sugar transport system permease protein
MRRRAGHLLPLALVLPAVVFLAVLVAIPLVQVLFLAMASDGGGFTFSNFGRMLADLTFGDALRNTLLLLVVMVPLQVTLALGIALLINSRSRGARWLRQLWLIPLAVSDLAAGILWLAIFTERGYLSSTLQTAGLVSQPVSWLSSDNLPGLVAAIVVAESWRTMAIVLAILLAGLGRIPRDLIETAELYGASRVRRVTHVVIPLLRPSLRSAVIVRAVLAVPIFAIVFALVGQNAPVLAGEAYTWYANNRDANVAAAYAAVVIGLSLLGTIAYLGSRGLHEAEVEA